MLNRWVLEEAFSFHFWFPSCTVMFHLTFPLTSVPFTLSLCFPWMIPYSFRANLCCHCVHLPASCWELKQKKAKSFISWCSSSPCSPGPYLSLLLLYDFCYVWWAVIPLSFLAFFSFTCTSALFLSPSVFFLQSCTFGKYFILNSVLPWSAADVSRYLHVLLIH